MLSTQNSLIEINSSINYKLGCELLKFEESFSRLMSAYDEFNDDEDPKKTDNKISSIDYKNGCQRLKKKDKVDKDGNLFYERLLHNHDSIFKRSHDFVF